MADVKHKSKKKAASSAHSSSTESLNSIPVSSDGEGEDKLKLKQEEADKPKKPPPLPPRPTRASTIDFTERKASMKKPKKKREASLREGDDKENGAENDQKKAGQGEEKTGEEAKEEEDDGQPKSKWSSMWKSTTSTMYSATSSVTSAVTTAKDATVNAAVKTKDATVNAAVTAKDATVNAAVKTKDVTVNAAVTAKDATVTAAVTAKDATVNAAVTAKDATVNAAVKTKDTTVSAASNTTSAVTDGFANVVILAKKAAKDTKHRMGPAADQLTILHFNDVYNVESREQEPVGGAARFATAFKAYDHLSPMILFSGDIFAPSVMSTFTKGEQMVPVLNKLGVHAACFGNHDFDFGVDTLVEHAEKTGFPWLISNVVDNETGRPLAEGKVSHVFEWWGRKIGLIGLVEKEWLDTLATINPNEVAYTDFVTAGKLLGKELREKGCDYVIALTHMRTPNDVRLSENVDEIDLILGGHDHVYEKKKVNGKFILKSGTDFRQFSVITLDFSPPPTEEEAAAASAAEAAKADGEKLPAPPPNKSGRAKLEVEMVEVTADKFEPDADLSAQLEKYTGRMETELIKELGEFQVDVDGRFSAIRTTETNLGNFVCDIVVAATNADFAILNSGTFRSDQVHPAGPFFLKDLMSILPMIDPIVLLEVTGKQVLQALENGVSQYPKLEGRFPQVSGISFAFDPTKKAGRRVEKKFVKVGDEYVEEGRKYRLATKAYLADGKDGYDCLADAKRLIDEENGPTLTYAVQNHFRAIAMREGRTKKSSVHHQSLVTMSRKAGIVRQLTEDGKQPLPAHLPEKFQSMDLTHNRNPEGGVSKPPRVGKQATITDLEDTGLKPRVRGRIRVLNPEVYARLEKRKERDMKGEFVEEEDEDEAAAAQITEDIL